MAFRQPTYQHYHAQRHADLGEASPVHDEPPQPNELLDESQEWLLFPLNPTSTTDRTFTATTQNTKWTAGQSRRSEYGSLETAARSHDHDGEVSEHTEAVIEEEEDGELDSLDSHLHEFRAETSAFQESSTANINVAGIPVLPTHDGLGSFRIDRTTMGENVQEHLYTFERYNPRRVKRRRESLELGQMALENERMLENERTRRIEEWRLGQSQALLDEIKKETRRRKHSLPKERRSMTRDEQEEAAILSGVLHGQSEHMDSQTQLPGYRMGNGFCRITRRVIRDLMGIDDSLLSILFGEALPEDLELSSTPSAKTYSSLDNVTGTDGENHTWEYRLLNRIALELGLLVNQLSDHPGAFSTYLKVQHMPLPYAGLPIIPEGVQDTQQVIGKSTMATSVLDFQPTLPIATQPSYSIHEVERGANVMGKTPRTPTQIHWALEGPESTMEFTQHEWEKQLDIKMVFRYLRSRFTSRPISHPPFSRNASNMATSSPQDAAVGIARVQQHHPLVNRQKPSERRSFKATVPNSPIMHRRSSSCASQSTRKSARRNSTSSRPYWDMNGSIGSGSLIASAGAWGEV